MQAKWLPRLETCIQTDQQFLPWYILTRRGLEVHFVSWAADAAKLLWVVVGYNCVVAVGCCGCTCLNAIIREPSGAAATHHCTAMLTRVEVTHATVAHGTRVQYMLLQCKQHKHSTLCNPAHHCTTLHTAQWASLVGRGFLRVQH